MAIQPKTKKALEVIQSLFDFLTPRSKASGDNFLPKPCVVWKIVSIITDNWHKLLYSLSIMALKEVKEPAPSKAKSTGNFSTVGVIAAAVVEASAKVREQTAEHYWTSITDSYVSEGFQATFDLIDKARVGLPNSRLREVSLLLELPAREMAPLLATTVRTLARRLENKKPETASLNKVESERLLLLQRLTEHGVGVFEDQGKFNRWLRRPLPILNGQSPLQLLDTASGFQVVEELLGRIEYGVYS